MEQRIKDTVYGYVRMNYANMCPFDIISVIYQFYLLRIESNILDSQQQINLLNLLYDTIKGQKGNENINTMETKFLFRASDHGYEGNIFHQYCDDKGPTLVIIRNEYDHIFGGYTTKSWKKVNNKYKIHDPNTFLFTVKPEIEMIGFKYPEKKFNVIWSNPGHGPILGIGDIVVKNRCNKSQWGCFIRSSSFKFDAEKLSGGKENAYKKVWNKIMDYEVFGVTF